MSETHEFIMAVLTMGLSVFIAVLYRAGGMYGTWIRRYLLPAFLALGITLMGWVENNMTWSHLLFPALLSVAFHYGYGASSFWVKVFKRTFYALLIIGASLPILYSSPYLFVGHMFIVLPTVVLLGVFNPINASKEELCIGFIATFIPLMGI